MSRAWKDTLAPGILMLPGSGDGGWVPLRGRGARAAKVARWFGLRGGRKRYLSGGQAVHVAARHAAIQLSHRNANFIGSPRLQFSPAIVC